MRYERAKQLHRLAVTDGSEMPEDEYGRVARCPVAPFMN
jgi:hypothetical protein